MSRPTFRNEHFAALALAWTATGVALAEEPAPTQWLERMNQALTTRNYDGTFSHWHGGHVEMLRIIHRVQDGMVSERLASLDGSGREFVRTGARLRCYLQDRSLDRRLPVVAQRDPAAARTGGGGDGLECDAAAARVQDDRPLRPDASGLDRPRRPPGVHRRARLGVGVRRAATCGEGRGVPGGRDRRGRLLVRVLDRRRRRPAATAPSRTRRSGAVGRRHGGVSPPARPGRARPGAAAAPGRGRLSIRTPRPAAPHTPSGAKLPYNPPAAWARGAAACGSTSRIHAAHTPFLHHRAR